jgi:hypothetical protein
VADTSVSSAGGHKSVPTRAPYLTVLTCLVHAHFICIDLPITVKIIIIIIIWIILLVPSRNT